MATSPVVVSPIPHLSEAERLADIFVAPTKTFRDILFNNRSWWAPFVLLLIFSTALGYTVQKQVGFERAYLNNLHNTPAQEDRINQMPPDQKEKALAISAKITAGTSYAFPVLLAIGFAVYALILWAIFNFGLGAQTTFGQVYAVTWYAALPYLLSTILTIITLWFGGNAEAYSYQNPIGTNLAYYLPDLSPALKAILGAFDIIKLWSVALQVVGMAIIAKKTITQSAVVIVGWWALTVAIATGAAVAFS